MKHQNSTYEKYEAILNAIKVITKADDCSVFLLDSELGMDEEEKKEVFDERIEQILEAHNDNTEKYNDFLINLNREDVNRYSILTYFVGTSEYWRLKSYKTRPHKYIIFNWPPPGSTTRLKHLAISKEGLTAYSVRTSQPLVLSSPNEVDKHKAFAGINEGETYVHDHCHQVALLPIKDKDNNGKVIGVIRCDIYKRRDPEFNRKDTIAQLKAVNDVLCKIINLGKQSEASSSYNKLFYGLNLLESLKSIKSDVKDDSDVNIYNATKKLFYVMKRRRYFGYKAIIERVMGYISDICETLQLDEEPIITLLESFRRHEDLMLYSNNKYRDHFMHQFHVFIVGYIILHYIGIENVTKLLNYKISRPIGEKLKVKNTLRIWFLASLFHDCSYILPEFDTNIGNFLTEILENPSNRSSSGKRKFEFSVDLKWSQLVNRESGFLESLSEIADHFKVKHQHIDSCKFTAELGRLMIERNHGVLGALIMLQKMSRADKWKGHIAYEIEKHTAALAIALHTVDAFTKTKETLRGKRDEDYIYFESHPIVFLLAFCDFLQEWGRKTTEKSKTIGSPLLYSLSNKKDEKKITCKLLYTPSSFSDGQAPPTREQLEKWARGIQSTFNSSNYNFIVEYYHATSENPSPNELDQKEPICPPINLKKFSNRERVRAQCNQFHSLIEGKEVLFTDFSYDPTTGKADVGFGAQDSFDIGKEINLKFIYGDIDLSGTYEVMRSVKADKKSQYAYFVGALRV